MVFMIGISGEGTEASIVDIPGDWTIIGETITIVNETVDVRGNVTIGDDGILILRDSTLIVNVTSVEEGLFVEQGGKLEAYSSTIEGNLSGSRIVIRNDTLLERTSVRRFCGDQNRAAITLEAGYVVINNSSVSSYGPKAMEVRTDLLMFNSTYSYIEFIYNHPDVVKDIKWVLRSCRYGIFSIIPSNGTGHNATATIEDSSFIGFHRALMIVIDRGLDLSIDGCTFTRNDHAITLFQGDGGIVRITNNSIVGPGTEGWSTGIEIKATVWSTLVTYGNMIEEVNVAYFIWTKEGPIVSISLNNLSARKCEYSVRAYSDYEPNPIFHISIHNSTFTEMYWGFMASVGTRISVYDTEHQPGYGRISENGHWIRAYSKVDVGEVRWMNGYPINEGTLDLIDSEENIVFSLNNEKLVPIQILGWERTREEFKMINELTPSVSESGIRFWGKTFDIWDYSQKVIEIVDDKEPEISVMSPRFGLSYNLTTIIASGTYSDAGSGLSSILFTLDNGVSTDLDSFDDGEWAFSTGILSEGYHELRLMAVDNVNNWANESIISFTVDTKVPQINLVGLPSITNTSQIVVYGSTEPWSTLSLKGIDHSIEYDGKINLTVQLIEGQNYLYLLVTDRAGNTNHTILQVKLDTTSPTLMVTYPWNGLWVNEREILVEGSTEVEANMDIGGVPVNLDQGRFNHIATLSQGDYELTINVTDIAGNKVSRTIPLNVDWTPPRLHIEEPERSPVYTRDNSIFILGTAEDGNLEYVSINGQEITIIDGSFVLEFEIDEGVHSFEIISMDAASNKNVTTILVFGDRTIPNFTINISAVEGELHRLGDNYYTGSDLAKIDITASESVFVQINGVLLGPGNPIAYSLELMEGSNELVVQVWDLAGNEAESHVSVVTFDSDPPSITLISPLPGYRTEDDSVLLIGMTEPGALLTVDGVNHPIGTDGTFQIAMMLSIGTNEISLEVEDLAGHSSSTSIVIHREEPVGGLQGAVGQWEWTVLTITVAITLGALVVLRYKWRKETR
jgi:hypothetical protein